MAEPESSDRILLRSGIAAYVSWVGGTAVGVGGGAALGLESLAASVFPVLFVGLAALMISGKGPLLRALAGAASTVILLLLWPSVGGLAPVIGGVVAALPGERNG